MSHAVLLIYCMYTDWAPSVFTETSWMCDEWEEEASSRVCCRWKHACQQRAEEKLSVQILSWEHAVHFASTTAAVPRSHGALLQRPWAPGPARWRHICTRQLHDSYVLPCHNGHMSRFLKCCVMSFYSLSFWVTPFTFIKSCHFVSWHVILGHFMLCHFVQCVDTEFHM